MVALKLVHNATPRRQSKPTIARPFQTDYAGAWPGHCKTRESAMNAAFKHITDDGYSRATITDLRTGQDVARLRRSKDGRHVTVETVKPLLTARK